MVIILHIINKYALCERILVNVFQVFHQLLHETRLVATSDDFGPCTIYTLKVRSL